MNFFLDVLLGLKTCSSTCVFPAINFSNFYLYLDFSGAVTNSEKALLRLAPISTVVDIVKTFQSSEVVTAEVVEPKTNFDPFSLKYRFPHCDPSPLQK